MTSSYSFSARPVRVVDGDTVILDVDVGFRLRTTQPFRLLGINCPEKRGEEAKYGKECTAHVEGIFDASGLPWALCNIRIVTHKNPDSFGRWLADLTIEGKDLVKDILIPGGWGVEWDGKGRQPRPWLQWDKYPNPITWDTVGAE